MKKHLILTAFLSIMAASAWAQATQPCIVLQYNQKKAKTPLSGVTVIARGSSTTTSMDDGKITLTFHTLKPGDKIKGVMTTKAGYEIFNKDVVDNWIVSRGQTVFELVMVRSDYLAQRKANLTQITQDSYRKKLEEQQKELEKQKEEGKLKEDEYQKKYDELYDNYYEQLNNLNNYIDRFARIDLSEISNEEQRIIELVEEGKIEEAIQAFDKLDLAKKIANEADDYMELTKAASSIEELRAQKKENLDALYESVKRKVSLRLMAHQTSEACEDLSSVLEVFSKLFREDPETYRPQVADLQLQLGELMPFREAGPYLDSALANYLVLYQSNPERYAISIAKAKTKLAQCKTDVLDFTSAEQLLLDALSVLERQRDQKDPNIFKEHAAALRRIGQFYAQWPAKRQNAENYFLSALEKYTTLTKQDTTDYLPTLASLKAEIGSTYEDLKIFDKAGIYMSDAITDYQILVKTDADYLEALEKQQSKLGNLYHTLWFMSKKEEYFIKAETAFKAACKTALETVSTHHFTGFKGPSLDCLGTLVKLYLENGQVQKAEDCISEHLRICDSLSLGNAFRISLFSDLGFSYLDNGHPELALPYLTEAVKLSEQATQIDELETAWLWIDLALCHFELGDTLKMEECFKKGFAQYDSFCNRIKKLEDVDLSEHFALSFIAIKKATHELKIELMVTSFMLYNNQNINLSVYKLKLQQHHTAFVMRNFPNSHEKIADEQITLGDMYADVGEYLEAEKCYQSALKSYELLQTEQGTKSNLHPDVARILHNLGSLYRDMKDFSKAENCYIQALQQYTMAEKFKYDTTAYLHYATALDTNRFKKNISLVQRHLASLYFDMKEFHKADTQFTQAYANYMLYFQTHPNEEVTWEDYYALADIYFWESYVMLNLHKMESYEYCRQRSVETFEALLKSYKNLPFAKHFKARLRELYFLEARQKADQDKGDESVKALVRCQELEMSNQRLASGYNGAAYAYARNKQYKEALKTIDRAISLDPEKANYYDSKGEILLMKGDKKGALKMWQKVLEVDPNFLSRYKNGTELYRGLKEKGLIE